MESIKSPDEQQREDPDLRADLALYDALIASGLAGKVYFDLHVGHQVDVFAWIQGQGRLAFEAKGSLHWLEEGLWRYLNRERTVSEAHPTPADQARKGALAASDALENRLDGHKPWIHAVLVLTDMSDPDVDISQFAKDRHVHVIWGLNDIATQLQEITRKAKDYHPPTELDIQAEAAAFDYRTPPPNWQPRVPAGRSVETPAGTRTTSVAEPASISSNSTVIYNYGTVIIQQPSKGGEPPGQFERANGLPAQARAATAAPDPSHPVGCENDPFDDEMPSW